MPDISLVHTTPFYELTALLALAAAAGLIGLLLRQPMIVSFIAVGLLAGPSALGIVQSAENVNLLAQLGLVVLLFLVGLKLDLQLIRTLGVVSLLTGLGQVVITALAGFLIAMALGLAFIPALYVAMAMTFSSTIIVVKILSDKREVDSLHGRIAIGILIVQDLVVVLAMIALSTMGVGHQGADGGTAAMQMASVFMSGVIMLAGIGVFARYIATPLISKIAHSPELLVTFAISWAALLASVAHHVGLSQELGGLLAGVSLASSPFREAIISRLSSLRDFLLLFFFIGLGAQLDLSLLGAQIVPAVIFSVFVLIGKPLIVTAIMGYMGYRKRTGFLTGVTLAQISEFSLIFVAMGLSLGHINADVLGLVTLVGLVTIALSIYMITYAHTLYQWLEPVLGLLERHTPAEELAEQNQMSADKHYDVILFGMGRYGSAIARHLRDANLRFLAIDFNPDEVRRWRNNGHDTLYGDAFDHEFIAALPLDNVNWVISAMPQHDLGLTHEDPRLVLINGLKARHYRGKIAVSTQNPDEIEHLKTKGADLVLLPFHDAAGIAISRIKAAG